MKGNVFMCLNAATYNEKIPTELVATYGIPSYNEEGEFVETLHPTFKELGEYNRGKFGVIIEVTIASDNYYIIELEASWKSGEITALLKLGEGLNYPNNTLMTNTEAIGFVNVNTPDTI